MKRISVAWLAVLLSALAAHADTDDPVAYHLSFENFDFAADDWVAQTGLKSLDERKWALVDGPFGQALYLGAVPLQYDDSNMSGLDLDMVTAIIFNIGYRGMKGVGYDEPFIWGAGKLHPGQGAVAFWAKGTANPAEEHTKTVLFEQTTTSWGRKERQLIEIELWRDGTISAYVEDARYVQHALKTAPVWRDDQWHHVVLMWDKAAGLALWINGREVASSMGRDAWWENQLPGLFHLPMAQAAYDELYLFNRSLTAAEIDRLYRENQPPRKGLNAAHTNGAPSARLKNAFTSHTDRLPIAQPSNGTALTFRQITPTRIHDEGIPGWWLADGRYELAWPHEYSVFTIIPGDVDFHAEKVDLLPPPGAEVNYITLEGHIAGARVLAGDRNGQFNDAPILAVPASDAFFYGALVEGLGDAELRLPFTQGHGAPPGFKSDDEVLQLPLSGDLRVHEIGLFNVSAKDIPAHPGQMLMHLNSDTPPLDDSRYPVALKALYSARDRHRAGLSKTFSDSPQTIAIAPMSRLHLLGEPASGKFAFDTAIADLWVNSPTEDNIVRLRLCNPAVPSHTWTQATFRLQGFANGPARLRLALQFDPAFLVAGDRVWLEIMATDGLSIHTGDPEQKSTIALLPETDWPKAEAAFALKALRPCITTYGRSFEYIPWEWDHTMPQVDAPANFGGLFDMAYPWQAVLKVNPDDRIANIYRRYTAGEYTQGGRWPKNIDELPDRAYSAPDNAPDWAVYFRHFQTFRQQIITWWRQHQRSDGQVGGGWNDDTLIFSRSYGDMPLDSNSDALALYNNVFDGFVKTHYFKDGYCRIYPIDRLHNGDFVRERYKSLIYNLGDPQSARWLMEEAWHFDKPEQTPINYGDGRAFLFGRDALEWYWGRRRLEQPYRLADKSAFVEILRKAALVSDDTVLWRLTEAWCHTDDQAQYGYWILPDMLLGGWGHRHSDGEPEFKERNTTIAIGVGWIEGGGADLGRLVDYSGNDGLRVHMYSFDQHERQVVARLYRLDPGRYAVSLRTDQDGDGTYETLAHREQRDIKRFDRIAVTVPPQVPVQYEFEQLAQGPRKNDLPDLAVDRHSLAFDDASLRFSVYNIGPTADGPFSVALKGPNGQQLATMDVEGLDGSADFVAQKKDLVFEAIPHRTRYTIEVDAEDQIVEIFEENNSAEKKLFYE